MVMGGRLTTPETRRGLGSALLRLLGSHEQSAARRPAVRGRTAQSRAARGGRGLFRERLGGALVAPRLETLRGTRGTSGRAERVVRAGRAAVRAVHGRDAHLSYGGALLLRARAPALLRRTARAARRAGGLEDSRASGETSVGFL